ncbi:MAG: hypothetical protein K0R31_98 [Clostridiales bacterium]|jgi:hypothetical protein|nr:hypothetical protein [Clostridiales bacterium]
MKRKLALVLSVIMLLVAMLPAQVFAEGDSGLQNAIEVVKSKLSIPENFKEFNYNINSNGDRKIWYLNWHSKDYADGSMDVSVDDSGKIVNYNSYNPSDYNGTKKLPKFSKQDAKKTAEEFIKMIDPTLMGKLSYKENENNYNTFMDPDYNFNYVRMENGIPYYSNNVSVRVNRNSGEVKGYHYNWTEGLVFPAADNRISLEKAQEIFKEKLGLELMYQYTVEDEKIKPFAAYALKENNNSFIDALTGEKITLSNNYGIMYDKGMMNEKMAMTSSRGGAPSGLSPEELEAVEKVSKLKSKEEVEKLARGFKTLGLNDEYKLENANLNRDWQDKDDFIWNLSFSKGQMDKMGFNGYVSVRIDAFTGEIKGFYLGSNYKEGDIAKFDEKASRDAVEVFLKEIQPEKFAQSYFDTAFNSNNIIYREGEKPFQYSFRYIRKVDGIPFTGNSMMVNYDAVSGKVVSFDMSWFDLKFPSVKNAISLEKVYEIMFKDVGLELQYVPQYNDEKAKSILPRDYSKPLKVRLVYTVKPGKPMLFDGNTGVLVNYNGQPYKEIKPADYKDIAGHYAESQIKILAEFGIGLEGNEFRPDENILQKDFLTLLAKTLNYYYYDPYFAQNEEKKIEEMYNVLLREGVIKAAEKAPNSAVTREDAVKFLIRALKYDKVADIKGIFKSTFSDVDAIQPDLVGYVTIAQGLGIIQGDNGYFNPKGTLTRAHSAVIIYNYLQK